MAWTTADRDRLKQAISDGAVLQSLTLGDQTFTFRSLDEMLRLLALMEQELKTQAGKSVSRLAATSKGV